MIRSFSSRCRLFFRRLGAGRRKGAARRSACAQCVLLCRREANWSRWRRQWLCAPGDFLAAAAFLLWICSLEEGIRCASSWTRRWRTTYLVATVMLLAAIAAAAGFQDSSCCLWEVFENPCCLSVPTTCLFPSFFLSFLWRVCSIVNCVRYLHV